jgi:hypothetical protein
MSNLRATSRTEVTCLRHRVFYPGAQRLDRLRKAVARVSSRMGWLTQRTYSFLCVLLSLSKAAHTFYAHSNAVRKNIPYKE